MNVLVGELFALVTAMCWAQNAIFYSFAGKRVSSGTTTHIRLWIALPLMMLIHFFYFGSFFPVDNGFGGYLFLAISGFIGFFIADLLIFEAFVLIGARDTMLVMTLTPFFSALFSWIILDEKLMLIHIAAIIITVAGIAWVVSEKNNNEEGNHKHKKLGLVIAVLGAVGQALGIIFSKIGLNYDFHPISANLIRISAGFIGLIIYALIKKEFFNDFKKMKDRKALLLIGIASFIGPVLGVVLSLYAVISAPVGIVSTLMQTSPIFILPVDFFYFKKNISMRIIFGTIISVIGASLFFLF